MTIVHIVLFAFKPATEKDEIDNLCKHFLSLLTLCIHPSSQKPYILALTGGKDNSPEGHQGPYTHAFTAHFANPTDRNYYVQEDPAHLQFTREAARIVQEVRVVDYEVGFF